MSSAILLETDGTYTRRNGYFGSYLEFLDAAYDRDENKTYLVALKPDNSLTLLVTADDGGTFTDLGCGDIAYTPTYTPPYETTVPVRAYIRGTMVVGGGILSIGCYNGNAAYHQLYSISTSSDFVTGWYSREPASTSGGFNGAWRVGDLYVSHIKSGIYTSATADFASRTYRVGLTGSSSHNSVLGIDADGTMRLCSGAGYYAISINGIDWNVGSEAFPASHTATTDKRHCIRGRAAIGNHTLVSAFTGLQTASFVGNIVVYDYLTGISSAHEIGEAGAATSDPKNKCIAVSWEPITEKFFATTQHEDTSVVTMWTIDPATATNWGSDWTVVNTAGSPQGALEIPQMSVILEVVT